MKNISRLSALLILLIAGFISVSPTEKKRRPFCGFSLKDGYYYEEKEQQYITREATSGDKSGIPDVVSEIEKKLEMEVPITVYISKNEENCFATIAAGGKRILIADHLFLSKVNKAAGTDWAAISIIAHEIGHHIAGFSRRPTQSESELDADYWSGYALQKLGAGREASIKCIMRYGTEWNTDTHPNKYSRASTIKQGWDDSANGSFDVNRCESCN
jgi:hypothetical protein